VQLTCNPGLGCSIRSWTRSPLALNPVRARPACAWRGFGPHGWVADARGAQVERPARVIPRLAASLMPGPIGVLPSSALRCACRPAPSRRHSSSAAGPDDRLSARARIAHVGARNVGPLPHEAHSGAPRG